MAVARVKLNRKGVRELLRSQEMQADLHRRGQRIANAAGPGHESQSRVGRNRARETVRTTTNEAALAEQHHQRLTNALSAGR